MLEPSASGQPGPLKHACGADPGIICRLVWDVSHSDRAAEVAKVFINGPALTAGRILFVLVLAFALRAAVRRVIARVAERAGARGEGGEHGSLLFRERRRQRAAALASVLGNASSLVIFGVSGAIILGDLGVNLAPILASAGVAGIAVGFGAQNLVSDFLAGAFMLMEDQYGVGDIITAGDVTGTVEAVSLRVTTIRDVTGVVWYIRNGTITRTGNQAQGWARAVVDFPVPYQKDLPRVRQAMAASAARMWHEPGWSEAILDEPEVWGVQDVSADIVTLRVAARTAPLRQWEVARELRERLKEALDASDGAEGAEGAGAGPAVG
jgi:small-conductance mechanosensitive channel